MMEQLKMSRTEPSLGLFIDTAPAAVAMFDRDMRYLHASNGWRNDFGLGTRDLRGLSHYEIFPEIPDRWKEIHRRALAGETVSDDQDRFERMDGSVQWLKWLVRPWYEPDRTIGGIVIFSEDITARTNVEEELRHSEQRYRSLAESTSDIVWHGRKIGDRIDVPQWCTLTGQTPEQADSNWQECIHPDDRGRVVPAWFQFIEQGGVLKNLYRLRFQDGKYHWVAVSGVSLNEKDGTIREWIGTFNDITDRKLAEQKLRESEIRERARAQQLETILDTIPVPVLIAHDPECRKITRNRAAWEQLGIAIRDTDTAGTSRELGHRFLQDGTPLAKGQLPIEQAVATGQPVYNVSTTLVREDGTQRYEIGNAAPLVDEHGKVWGAVGARVDITERIRAEEALRGSENRLSLAQEVAQIGSFDRNLVTGEVNWSSTLAAIYGLRPGQFPRNDDEFMQLLHPGDRTHVTNLLNESRERGEGNGEWRTLWPDGTVRWISSKWRVLKDATGRPMRSIGCDYDITDRKLIEAELQKAKERLTEEKLYLEQEIDCHIGAKELIGSGTGLKRVMEDLTAVAPTDSTVLLLGETGTGKEVIARTIHENSKRAGKSFIKVNCAAIPSGLLESELFGAERGAFTGAVTRKIGRIELADGGTLFLDEIGEILPSLQPKLLRVLQEQEFERLGGTRTLKVDFRLIAATNRDLLQEVQASHFRSDLYYRLSVFPIMLPALRDRVDDVPALVEHFVQKYAKRMGKKITSIPKRTLSTLQNWKWPGNIRELENFIERSVILTTGSVLSAPLSILDPDEGIDREATDTSIATLANVQRQHILDALRCSQGRVSGPGGAAARLGLKRTTLQSKMKQMGIDPHKGWQL